MQEGLVRLVSRSMRSQNNSSRTCRVHCAENVPLRVPCATVKQGTLSLGRDL